MVLYYSQLTVLNSEFILFWVFNLFAFNTLLWIPIPILLIFITYEVYKIKATLKILERRYKKNICLLK